MAQGRLIISNTTPIINFAEIGRLDLLGEIFGKVVVPRAVVDELLAKRSLLLLAVVDRLAKEKNAAIVGTVQKVLCEGPSKNNPSTLSGRTPQNKIVIFEGDENKLTGEILDIAVKESTGFTTYGAVV